MLPLLPALLLAAGGLLQGPPDRFELEIPAFPDQSFRGSVIELPVESLDQIVIHVLEPLASRVSYAKIFPRLNLQSAAVITQVRSSARGKSVVLNLQMRPDIRLEPGLNALEITVIDVNGRRYYRNWILRLKEEARNEWFAYELTQGPEEGPPPEVVIEQPAGPLPAPTGTVASVRIRGKALARRPLRHLLVGGRAVSFPDQSATAAFEAEVLVERGQRNVLVEAADVGGNRTRVSIPVSGAGDAPAPTPTADRMAILIGVSRYQHRSSLLCAPGAQGAQAESIASALKTGGGFAANRVLVLKDDQATLAGLRNALRNAAAEARPDDLLLVYFGGCGMQDPIRQERFYLAAFDTQPNAMEDTALELGELEKLLDEQIRSRNVLLAFEVSASPLLQDNLDGANLLGTKLLRLASQQKGRSVLVAPPAAGPQLDPAAASSRFAEAVKEALEGMADVDHDRFITTRELVRYVSHRVRGAPGGSAILAQEAENPAVVVALKR
ncbi:MAG: caspase family protein [Bryobacteraceae bacterium]